MNEFLFITLKPLLLYKYGLQKNKNKKKNKAFLNAFIIKTKFWIAD